MSNIIRRKLAMDDTIFMEEFQGFKLKNETKWTEKCN